MKIKTLSLLLISLMITTSAYSVITDSVIVVVKKQGYEVDVINPGRYVVVKNFSGRKVEGKIRVINRSMIMVGTTVVPLQNISKLTVKSTMYPFSKRMFRAGKYVAFTFTGKMFAKFGFSSAGAASILLLTIAVLVAIVLVFLGLLIMFVSLPGILVGKTYNTKYWRIYIKPRK